MFYPSLTSWPATRPSGQQNKWNDISSLLSKKLIYILCVCVCSLVFLSQVSLLHVIWKFEFNSTWLLLNQLGTTRRVYTNSWRVLTEYLIDSTVPVEYSRYVPYFNRRSISISTRKEQLYQQLTRCYWPLNGRLTAEFIYHDGSMAVPHPPQFFIYPRLSSWGVLVVAVCMDTYWADGDSSHRYIYRIHFYLTIISSNNNTLCQSRLARRE